MRFGPKLLVSLMAWAVSPNAWCQTVGWIDPGQVELSQNEPILLQFHVPGLSKGTNVRLKAENGRIQAQPVQETGLLIATYQPDAISDSLTDTVEIRIRSMGLLESVSIHLSSPAIAADSIQFDPQWVKSRPNEAITAQVRIRKTQDHPPWLRASMGELSPPSNDGEDWVWTWKQAQAPDSSAIVGFILTEPTRPDRVQATGVLPLHVQQSVTLDGPPGFSCAVVQEEARSESVKVTPAGTLAMSVAVDPTKTTALLECTNPLGQVRDYPFELRLADVPLYALGQIPNALPIGATSPAYFTVYSFHSDGRPNSDTHPDIEGTNISIGELIPDTLPGTWRGPLLPEAHQQPWTVVATENGHTQQRQGETISDTPPLEVTAEPAVLGPDQRKTQLQIHFRSEFDVTSRDLPALTMLNGQTVSSMKRNDSGASTQARMDKGQDGIWVLSSPPPNETGLPAARLLAWAPNSTLLADSTSQRPIAIVATDAMGHGVSQVEVNLGIESESEAKLSASSVRTGPNGVAWTWLTAGNTPGPLVVRAAISNDYTTAPLLALPTDDSTCASNPAVCEPHSFIPDGDATRRALETAWQERALLSWIPYRDEPLALQEPSSPTVTAASPDMASEPQAPSSSTTIDPAISQQTGSLNRTLPPLATLPRARFSLGIASLSHVYQSASPLGAAAPNPVTHQKGNLMEGNPAGTVAGTGHMRLQIQQYSIDAGWLGSRIHLGQDDNIEPNSFHSGWIDLRKNHPIRSAWNVYYGAGAAYQGFHVLLYDTSQPGTVMVQHMPTPGARLTAGAQWANHQLQVELEISETFVPWPVRSSVCLRGHRQIRPNLYGTLGLEFHARSARYAAGADEILVEDQLQVLSLGITKDIP